MIKFFIYCLIIFPILFCLVKFLKHNNLEEENRFLQLWHLIISSGVSLICIICYNPFVKFISWLISLKRIAEFLEKITPSYHFALAFIFLIFIVTNFLVFLIENIALLFVKMKMDDETSYRQRGFSRYLGMFANLFYTIDDEDANDVNLRAKFYSVGKWLNIMRLVFLWFLVLEIFAVIFVLTCNLEILPAEKLEPVAEWMALVLRKTFLLPIISYVLTSEYTYFLGGDLKIDSPQYQSTNIPSITIGTYDNVFQALKSRFPSNLLWSNQLLNELIVPFFDDVTSDEKKRTGKEKQEFVGLVNTVKGLVENRSIQYRESFRPLLRDESILIYDSPFGDYFPYLVAYLQSTLAGGKKILYVCESETACNEVKDELEKAFSNVNLLNKIWNIKTETDNIPVNEIDILVCTIPGFYDHSSFERWKKFLIEVGLVVVNNTIDFFSGLSRYNRDILFSRLDSKISQSQFIFISEIRSNEIKIAVEGFISNPGEIKHNVNTFSSDKLRPKCDLMIWKSEGAPEIEFDGAKISLGMEMSLCDFALQRNVSSIICCAPAEPIESAKENLRGRTDRISIALMEMKSTRHPFDTYDLTSLEQPELTFTVIGDRMNNLVRAAELRRKFAGEGETFINIVSRPYMLREFFAENIETLMNDTEAFSVMFPNTKGKIGEDAIVLLMRSFETGVKLSEIKLFLADYNVESNSSNIWDILDSFIGYVVDDYDEISRNVFSIEDYCCFDYQKVNFCDHGDYIVRLTDKKLYESVCDKCRLAVAYLDGSAECHLPVSAGDVKTYCFPGRVITFGGKLYSVSSSGGRVSLSGVDYQGYREYLPWRRYCLSAVADSTENNEECCLNDYTSDLFRFRCRRIRVRTETLGFLALRNGYNFANRSAAFETYAKADISSEKIRNVLHLSFSDDAIEYLYNIKQKIEDGEELDISNSDEIDENTPLEESEVVIPTEESEESIPTGESEESVLSDESDESVPVDKVNENSLASIVNESIPTDEIGGSIPTEEADEIIPSDESKEENPSEETTGSSAEIPNEDASEEDTDVSEEIPDEDTPEQKAEKEKKAYYTIAALLNGLFKTMFPTMYEFIVAVPADSKVFNNKKMSYSEKCIDRMTGNVSFEDGLEPEKGIYLIELAETESRFDMIFREPHTWAKIENAINLYLDWLSNASSERNWFCFGDSAPAECFMLNEVTELFKNCTHSVNSPTGENLAEAAGQRCCFCGRVFDRCNVLEPYGDSPRFICLDCFEHDVKDERELRKMYIQARNDMERIYDIKMPGNIKVEFASANTIAKDTGTGGGGGRVLGYYNRKTHVLKIEQGGPKEYTLSTIYHELTHAWQYSSKKVKNSFGKDGIPLTICKGQATFVEVDCLKKINKNKALARHLANYYRRLPEGDPYGDGFKMFEANVSEFGKTSFMYMEEAIPLTWLEKR